jgi:hypothetical protein
MHVSSACVLLQPKQSNAESVVEHNPIPIEWQRRCLGPCIADLLTAEAAAVHQGPLGCSSTLVQRCSCTGRTRWARDQHWPACSPRQHRSAGQYFTNTSVLKLSGPSSCWCLFLVNPGGSGGGAVCAWKHALGRRAHLRGRDACAHCFDELVCDALRS